MSAHALALAVGVANYIKEMDTNGVPDAFTVLIHVERHPCDGEPYMAHVDVEWEKE